MFAGKLRSNCRPIICLLICCRLSCHMLESFFCYAYFVCNFTKLRISFFVLFCFAEKVLWPKLFQPIFYRLDDPILDGFKKNTTLILPSAICWFLFLLWKTISKLIGNILAFRRNFYWFSKKGIKWKNTYSHVCLPWVSLHLTSPSKAFEKDLGGMFDTYFWFFFRFLENYLSQI